MRKPTLGQQHNAGHHNDKDDEEFGCSKEVLDVTGQLDAETVDQHYQH